ncbi:hypothetical protein Ae201684_009615 [Aphanomyces euteiches]|uniref:EGF-like domain-containing protein n=1 Tax=Aphanomyces euteiches TaxID=100861 RepID=A0A6G0X0Q6_9STRA|nr:hypothetical protein Ae201684_009615 [Aphanomyces euteiches]KAH9157860.1 hypothetical protein AeRB84_000332 [Aphanomyces euteiches]
MQRSLLALLLLHSFSLVGAYKPLLGELCNALNDCNGHGICNTQTKVCSCVDGWGSANDISTRKSADCSQRICPSGPSWSSVPTGATTAHAVSECSDMGICDPATGQCKCFPGFVGAACERTSCPNDCSGHGICVSMRVMATMTNAMPLSAATTYAGQVVSFLYGISWATAATPILGYDDVGSGSNLWLRVRFSVDSRAPVWRSPSERVVWFRLLVE